MRTVLVGTSCANNNVGLYLRRRITGSSRYFPIHSILVRETEPLYSMIQPQVDANQCVVKF